MALSKMLRASEKSLCGKGITELCKRILLLLQSTEDIQKMWIQWLHFRFCQTKCSCVSKVASWSWGMSWSGIVLTSEEWYRFGLTWTHGILQPTQLFWGDILSPQLCKRMNKSGIPWWCSDHLEQDLRLNNFADESTWISSLLRSGNAERSGQADRVQTTVPMPVSNHELPQRSEWPKPSILRTGNSWKVPPCSTQDVLCWNILTHAQTSKFEWKDATWTPLLSTGCRISWKSYFTESRVRAMRPRLKSAALSASVLKPNDNAPVALLALVMAKLWLQDCLCTWFLSTISVSSLAWLMPVIQRWQAAGTSQAQVVATSG